jgi:hypothetical protein
MISCSAANQLKQKVHGQEWEKKEVENSGGMRNQN